ncbi:organic cation transporter protein-like [Clavelina lepadiformis]|uniref:organic cation transporter protein-like n=1 Tax=Clavelina lepadiformis TaxID=159417 RepID=UPI0040435062
MLKRIDSRCEMGSNRKNINEIEDVETALRNAGACGLFHIWLILLTMLPFTLTSANMASSIFEGYIPNHRCDLPFVDSLEKKCNKTWTSTLHVKAAPLERSKSAACFRYQPGPEINCSYWFDPNNTTETPANIDTVPCQKWTYDRSVMRNTIVTDFSLVCGSTWASYISQSCFMLGVLLGSILFGILSDRLGRRHTFLMCSVGGLITGTATAFTQSYMSYGILRTISGFFVIPPFLTLYVLVSEMVVVKYRVSFLQLTQVWFATGYILLSLVSYLAREWRTIQLVLSLLQAFSIVVWWFIPESPRWLLCQHRHKEAQNVIDMIYQYNHCLRRGDSDRHRLDRQLSITKDYDLVSELEEMKFKGYDVDRKQQHGLTNLLGTPGIRKVSLVHFFHWFAIFCVYFGLTLNAAKLGGDSFFNLIVASLMELVSYVIVIPMTNKFGRVVFMSVSEVTAGILCIMMPYIAHVNWLYITTSILGKFFISFAFALMFIHVSEVFPTPIRSAATGMCSAWARVGGIASPLIAMLTLIAPNLPYTIFGIISLVTAFVILILPETGNVKLPSTIEEGEEFIKSHPGPLLVLMRRFQRKT